MASHRLGILTFFVTGNKKNLLRKFMQNWATGIKRAAGSTLSLNKTLIFNCTIALETE